MKKLVALDFETTGLDARSDEILQVALVDAAGGTLMNEYCRPEHHTDWGAAQKINGIGWEQVKDCLPFRARLAQLLALLTEADGIIAYNDEFERGFLAAAGVDVHRLRWAPDPMKTFAEQTGGTRRSLSAAAGFFDIRFAAHDALEDTRATMQLYHELEGETLLRKLLDRGTPTLAGDWVAFDEADALQLLKVLGLSPLTARRAKPLVYRGVYSAAPAACTLLGAEPQPLAEDAAVLVIEAGGRQLRICDACLREMQSGAAELAPAESEAAPAPQKTPAPRSRGRSAVGARAKEPAEVRAAAVQDGPAAPPAPAKRAPSRRAAAFAAKKTDLHALVTNENADPGNPFFGRVVVFTGDLAMPRPQAAAAVAALGARVKSSVTRDTDYLVLGTQDPGLVGADGRSEKERRAEALTAQGKANIRVLREAEFLTLLASAPRG